MRQEHEVLHQLLAFANEQETIRAVIMNGSRVNPNSPKDFFCDYDVVYYTTDPRRFLEDQAWIAIFGELVILQQNDYEIHGNEGHIFLMLFSDGVRIDLSYAPLANLEYAAEETLAVALLDKDGRIPSLPPPSESGNYTPKPSAKTFAQTTNEIFWCSNNVAKGIWRDELPYAKAMIEAIIRPCFQDLLAWHIASQHNWQVNTGMFGKWFKRYLPSETWQQVLRTYAGVEKDELWDSLFELVNLTSQVGVPLAQELGYDYPLEDDHRMKEYLLKARSLPEDAVSFEI